MTFRWKKSATLTDITAQYFSITVINNLKSGLKIRHIMCALKLKYESTGAVNTVLFIAAGNKNFI